jgi:hypothetical protein
MRSVNLEDIMIIIMCNLTGIITDNIKGLIRDKIETISNKINNIIKTTRMRMMTEMRDVLKEEGSLLVEEAEQEEEWAKKVSLESNVSMMIRR